MHKGYLGIIGIAGLIVLAIMLPSFLPKSGYSAHPINGYSGIAASWTAIDHQYYEENMLETVAPTTADLKPDFFLPTDICGLHAEVTQPYQQSTRLDWTDTIAVPDFTAETNKTVTWEVHIVKMRFAVYIYTRDGGSAAIKDVNFVLHLEENPFTVFNDAKQSKAYIIEAQTYSPTETTDSNLVKVDPTGNGVDFPPENSEPGVVPQWITDSGYQSSLGQYFESFDIVFTVNSMMPSSFFNIARADQHATFYVELDVLLFGQWEVTTTFKKADPGEKPLLESIIDIIMQFLIVLAGFVGMVVLFYFAPGRWKIAGVVVFAFCIALSFGWLDPWLGVLG